MAVLFLTGVMEDGTELAPTVPANPRVELAIPQGGTTQVFVRVTNRAGVPVTGEPAATLRVKQRPGDGISIAQLTGTWAPLWGGPGVVVFTFTPEMFSSVPWGRYVYDVTLDAAGVINKVIPASPFVLQPTV